MIPLFESVLSFTELRAFLSIAIKHKRLMVLCLCLGLTLSLAYAVYKRPVYYSKALVRIMSTDPLPVDAQVIFRDSTLPSVVGQFNAPHIFERTAKALGFPCRYEAIMDQFIKQQKTAVNSEGDLEIEIWPYSNTIARDWPQELVAQYLEYREEKRLELREKRVATFTAELTQIRNRIEDFEKERLQFLEDQKADEGKRKIAELSAVPVQLAIVNQKLNFVEPIQQRLQAGGLTPIEALSLLASTRQKLDQLSLGAMVSLPTTQQTAQQKNVIITPDLLPEENWTKMDREERRLNREIEDALKIYLPGHQKVLQLQEQLNKVRQEINLELEMLKKRFDLELAELKEQKINLTSKHDELQTLLRNDSAMEREFNRMQSARLAWESMYSQIAKSLEAMDFGADKERVSVQYMGLIDYREQPVSPYRMKVFLLGLAFGLAMAIAVPFLLEYLDDTVSFDEQVNRQLGLRTIGIIPKIEPRMPSQTPINLLSVSERHRQLTEYFRVLRVNLLSDVAFTGRRQLILVTSSLPKEGKSIVALNLATSFAGLGEKTLLIDADLRRGTLHHVFNVPSRPGVGQLLKNEITLDQATLQTSEKNLFFIPCGRHVHAASELLESRAFGELLQTLRGQYQRIILDTPPVLGLAETSSMSKHADGVLLIIWSGGTAFKAVKTAKSILDANGAQFFGCVLNKLDLSSATAYYYYYYYSYRYYHAYHAEPEPFHPAERLLPISAAQGTHASADSTEASDDGTNDDTNKS